MEKRPPEESLREDEPPGQSVTEVATCRFNTSWQKPPFSQEDSQFERSLNISYKINSHNFKIKIFNDVYTVTYSDGVLKRLDRKTKEVIVNNFVYNRTIPLSMVFDKPLFYHASKPFLKVLSEYGVVKDAPRFSELAKLEGKKLIDNIKKEKMIFRGNGFPKKLLPAKKTSEKCVVLSLSFGRDSLLTYAIAKEIGLIVHPVFINDMGNYNQNEFKVKERIIETFIKEQNDQVFLLRDDTDNIFRSQKLKGNFEELDGTNAMLSFAIELIPLAFYHGAKFIIFGNEKNLDDFFVNKENLKVYPSFDQSSIYMKEENKYLYNLTAGNIQVASLVKPIYAIAETKILYHRYPYLLKYMMSCSSKDIIDSRWCCNCTTCARYFLLIAAIGGKPQNAGINENFFDEKYRHFFTLFNPMVERIYDRPTQVKEEQLLAFLLAYKNGFKGKLIDLFKDKYLKEAKGKEAILRKKFFGIYFADTLPKNWQVKILKIFKEELKDQT